MIATTFDSFFGLGLGQEERKKAAAKRLREKAKAEEEYEAAKNLIKELGLDTSIQLIGPLYINQEVYNKLAYSLKSVVIESLVTKPFGRWEIFSGIVSHANIIAFLLTSLFYAAPGVALIAGLIRFLYVFFEDLYDKRSWKYAVQHASKEALKTAIKFFIVYMVWTLAVSLAIALGIYTGPLLLLGIVLVGVLTSLGFTVASFLVDKLPGLIHSFYTKPKETWMLFKTNLYEIIGCVIPGIMEGFFWTLFDNPTAVNISARISGFTGKVLDLAIISVVVSLAFFIGVVIHCSLSRWFRSRKTPQKIESLSSNPKKLTAEEKKVQKTQTIEIRNKIQEEVIKLCKRSENSSDRDLQHDLQDLLDCLNEYKIHDPLLTTTIVQFVQYIIVLRALENITGKTCYSLQTRTKIELTPQEKKWLRLTTDASKNQLNKLKKLKQKIRNSSDMDKIIKIQHREANPFKHEIEAKRKASFEKLQKFGVFSSKISEADFSSMVTSPCTPVSG